MEKWEQNLFIKKVRQAIDDFDLIQAGDRILVGVSGGKDSTLLFYTLTLLSQYKIYDFEVTGLTIDHGMLEGTQDYHAFCKMRQMDHQIHDEPFGERLSIANDIKPCYTCSRLRKGIIRRYALENHYNKIAFGHTRDDLVETFLMNILQHGKMASIPAIQVEKNSQLQMIRPLIYVEEDNIIKAIRTLKWPIIESKCTFAEGRSRANAEDLIQIIEKVAPDFSDKVIESLKHIKLDRLLDQSHYQVEMK